MKKFLAKASAFIAVAVVLGGYCFVCPQGVRVAKAAEAEPAHCLAGSGGAEAVGRAIAAAQPAIAHEPAYCPMSHGAGATVLDEGNNDPRFGKLHRLANPALVSDLAPRHCLRTRFVSLASAVPRQKDHLKFIGTVFKRE